MTKVFSEAENILWAKQLPGKMTGACLAIIHQGRVLMVKANYKTYWTFPGGIVDDGESPQQAAVRETREETGLVFDYAKCTSLGTVYTAANGGHRDRFNFAFTTQVDTIDDLTMSVPNDEIDEVQWVPFDKVAAMANHKASYVALQSILLGDTPQSSYVEVIGS